MVEITYQMVLSTLQTVGILVGIFYYIMTLKNTQELRRREQMYLRFQIHDMDYMRAYSYIMSKEFKNNEEFLQHFDMSRNPEEFAYYIYIGTRYQNVGLLLREGKIDPDLVFEIFNPMVIIQLWEKILPVEIDTRLRNNHPDHYSAFEYLYNEAKKRYPEITPTKISRTQHTTNP